MMHTRSLRLAVVTAAVSLVAAGLAPSAAAEPKHEPPSPELGSCPTGWELWYVPDPGHTGWFEYVLNDRPSDRNGNGLLCRKVVTGKGVQHPDHDTVWVAKDDAKPRD